MSRIDQLRDRIRGEGGRWDGKRALAAYRELGLACTPGRARHNLALVAEQNPGLLTAVEGERWTYDVQIQRVSARDALWENLGIDPHRISREEFEELMDIHDRSLAEPIPHTEEN